MPALRTLIDGVPIATVSCDGYNVLSVRVSGTRIDEELAMLVVSGGVYPVGGECTHLIWATDVHVLPHQEVAVQFLVQAETSHDGKTIDELYGDAPPHGQKDFTPIPEMFEKLRTMPTFRERFMLSLESSRGNRLCVDTTPDEHGFAFSVVWNSFSPQHARMSLHSYTLQNLEDGSEINYYVQEEMNCGDEVTFGLVG